MGDRFLYIASRTLGTAIEVQKIFLTGSARTLSCEIPAETVLAGLPKLVACSFQAKT